MPLKKYRLEGLDCADCASRLEQSLARSEHVNHVTLNFATATLALDTDQLELVCQQIRGIDPDVTLIAEETDSSTPEPHAETRQELLRIGVAALLFLVGLLTRGFLQATPYAWVEYALFMTAYFLVGWRVIASAFRGLLRGRTFDENLLMTVATFGAIALRELPEAVGVMLFFAVGEFFQALSVRRSRRSIQALLAARPEVAHVQRGEELVQVAPEQVVPGEIVRVRPGEKIPLDGEVLQGSSQVDTSTLTGESVPRSISAGDTVLAGMINMEGGLSIRVTRLFRESSVAKILQLVEDASARKAKTERFITRFARYYTPGVVLGAVLLALLPPLAFGAQFSVWAYRALILLVISCPCALVVSIPLGYFGGIGKASRSGILIKGAGFLDALTSLKTVVFDKTGTLTHGVFRVTDTVPHNGFSEDQLLRHAATAESQSTHPIAQSVREAHPEQIPPTEIEELKEIAGRGIRARTRRHALLVGSEQLMVGEGIAAVPTVEGTVVHVAVDGVYAGFLRIEDTIRKDSVEAIRTLKSLGVEQVQMLTGDNETTAARVAAQLQLDGYRAGLLPEDKIDALETIMQAQFSGNCTAFVGDGINDAPVITRADVGFAMGGIGSDAAIETADVVIMTDAPSKVATAIEIACKTRRIVWQNIVLALSIKGAVIVLGIVGIATMWEAVFADVGVALIAVLNSTRVLR